MPKVQHKLCDAVLMRARQRIPKPGSKKGPVSDAPFPSDSVETQRCRSLSDSASDPSTREKSSANRFIQLRKHMLLLLLAVGVFVAVVILAVHSD